jgi:C-terminal processing protease CtpA/Prc
LEDELFDLDLIKESYLTNVKEYSEGGLVTGWIGNTGYAYFKYISDNFLYINEVLDEFKSANGLIIDLRHNGGGDFTYTLSEIGRLTNETRLTHRSKTKIGPGENDFTEWFEWKIYPEGEYFDKPLVLLTDRYTISAGERATMALKVLPNLVHMGDTTNGAHSTMIGRELVNGWCYTVSPQKIEFIDGKTYEGIGLIPDIAIKNTMEEMNAKIDKTLEKALEQF